MSTQHIITPAVYVGTYRKYNNGSLAGEWLVLDEYTSKDEFYEACQQLHKDEADPELMFQDWEDVPDSLIGESWISSEYWEFLQSGGDSEAKRAFIAWYGSWDAEAFEESYRANMTLNWSSPINGSMMSAICRRCPIQWLNTSTMKRSAGIYSLTTIACSMVTYS